MSEVKKPHSKGWTGVIIATVLGVLFLGFLFLSMQHDTKNVNQYSKTWAGDKQETSPMASMPMSSDDSKMQHHGH
ncbi:hypothetical protein GCM10027155_21850 [Acinetobacter apis]|uniref:Uncharacterized protein n=1 Tax=Acinetobacter apis TaxID=1229165 RepID=A0A217EIB4_9GAMM|nr:hypothetical protein [Acinetobacter apis]SNQ29936.1 hypothetical protein SAMN05444584_1915 [Acinetobacter apis]